MVSTLETIKSYWNKHTHEYRRLSSFLSVVCDVINHNIYEKKYMHSFLFRPLCDDKDNKLSFVCFTFFVIE